MNLFDCTTRLWENPMVPQVNMLKSRSPLFTWKNEDEALHGTFEPFDCPAIQSLNGTWDFWIFKRPEDVDTTLVETATPSGAQPIQVPGNWTRQGFDNPHYVNVCMPFGDTPPMVPQEKNPTGVYRREFDVRDGFERIVLYIGGMETCGFIYINGQAVGMAKDSKTASEFDVTDFVHAGKNLLAIIVVRWSDGSFLEDQDHWRMAGITRDVYLQYTPKAHVVDVFAQTSLDEETESTGILTLKLEAGFRGAHRLPLGWKFRVQLYYDNEAVWSEAKELEFRHNSQMYHYPEECHLMPSAEAKYEIPSVHRWSAETPELYRLTVCLIAPDGSVAEATGTDIGFRSVRLKDGCLMINGQPVKFFGVNRHDFDEKLGKTVTYQDIVDDLTIMKRFNFNAIRTCHYPNDERLLAVANRMGFYVICEANIEIHAYYMYLSSDPLWLSPMMDRLSRMIGIYKNNPCIHLWSMGNEAGRGENFAALCAYAHYHDPSRLVHYCELARKFTPEDGYMANDNVALVDTISPMYPEFKYVQMWIDKNMPVEPRPFIMCEYTHAMGNSNGGLFRYFDYFRNYKRMQGGYIWDWIDQGLAEVDEKGRKYWNYGGDYGEEVHDFNFCVNGMILPDRTPHPGCLEHKFLARTFDFSMKHASAGCFVLTNWNYFVTLDDLDFSWCLELDGACIQKGRVPAADYAELAPQASKEVVLDYDLAAVERKPRQRLFLNIAATLKNDTMWEKAGFVVAEQQFELTDAVPVAAPAIAKAVEPSALAFSENTINDGESIIHFTDGAMPDQWLFRGEKILNGAVAEQFVRGLVDNDGIKGEIHAQHRMGAKWIGEWDIFNLKVDEKLASSKKCDGGLNMFTQATYTAKNNAAIAVKRNLTMDTNGVLNVEISFCVPEELNDLPRLGVSLPLMQGFENFHFFGKGPQECYWDRQSGARMGLYNQSVTEQYFPYVMPQECGNHTCVEMAAVDNGKVGLMVVSCGQPLEVSALHYTPQDFFKARHINELDARKETFLNVDIHQRGLGTRTCGEDAIEECRIHAGWHRLAFKVLPYVVGTDLMELARKLM